MITLFQKAGLRYLFTHPWQTALSILGIALGVGIILSIDIANESSTKAFDISMETVTGKASHRLMAKEGDIDIKHLVELRKMGLDASAPVIEQNVKIKGKQDLTATLLGLDPFSEADFRNFIDLKSQRSENLLPQLLRYRDRVVVPGSFAEYAGFSAGDTVMVEWQGRSFPLIVEAVLPVTEDEKSSINQFLIADLETARALFNQGNAFTYIDLILDDRSSKMVADYIDTNDDIMLKSTTRSNDTARSMTEAFRLNLNAMSMLGLVVGLFLIYNAMTFSVVQRRKLLALFRSMGVTGREIYTQIIAESVFIASAGTLIGVVAGIALGTQLLDLVTQSINDLYFVTNVRSVDIPTESVFKAVFAGIAGTLLASIFPAYEAANTPPGQATRRSTLETNIRKRSGSLAFISLLFMASGVSILMFTNAGILISYTAMLFIIISFALLTPVVVIKGVALIEPAIVKVAGGKARLGVRGITANLSRTTVAIAALAIAVSATIGVSTMISSFRGTVISWLEQTLVADLFVSAPGLVSRKNEAVMDKTVLTKIESISGVRALDYYSESKSSFMGKEIEVFGSGIDPSNEGRFDLKEGDQNTAWKEIREGKGALVTETFAYKWGLTVGDSVEITTPSGNRRFKVSAIYYDYSSETGHIAIDHAVYSRIWKNDKISGIGVYLDKGVNSEMLKESIKKLFPEMNTILIRSNGELREYSVQIFDRTFIVAGLLHILSVVVAFIGILSAMMSIQLEKGREMGILRATGLTQRQMFGMISVQTTTMGLLASLIAIPLGVVLAYCLIYVINLRSFGWTMNMMIDPFVLIQAIVISVFASVIAGLWPAYKMAVTSPAMALREE